MSDKFKKIDKEFCVTDNSVNVYKYRCLSEGLQLDEVKRNPIGYFLHGTEEFPREMGVLVRWEDFRVDGDKVYAKPCINLSHPRGQRTVDEIEGGFLNAASVGKITVLDASSDKSLMLSGQERPTVTKWFPREISLVDIPGNYNALSNLYDAENNELSLVDFEKITFLNMSNNTLDAAKILTALNLKAGDEGEVVTAINNLVDKANKSDEYKTDLDTKTKELKDLKDETVKKQVEDLIDKGKTDKKLTNEVAAILSKSYATNPEDLKALIDTMPAQVSVTNGIKDGDPELKKFEGKSWDDLYASEELETVRKKFPELYTKLKDEKYPNLKD
ncbi:Mu-like prophage I protein [Chryseobacterium ureilyticum]|uniref:Mu-like prophage I protein n=1 Tax=Chryseobacterium ureilyticum TaxID=373668 RepID=A0A1N7QRT7_9FLAO|nr:phage protease [Chryseobacterium ureilyticum]SIT25593.1 Mu-like prophage I protein [Chryseobacterium ureilyticum]